MQIKDYAPSPKEGRFRLQVLRGGELIDAMDETNVIVDGAKSIQCQLLGGDPAMAITQIGFGTGGSPADPGNSVLTGAYVKGVTSVSYPASNIVRFNFTLANFEANGLDIQEFGLLTTGGLLYARKVRGVAIPKAADLSLAGTWDIVF